MSRIGKQNLTLAGALALLTLSSVPAAAQFSYRWEADEPGFAMPIKVGSSSNWQIIQPTTTEWKQLSTPLTKDNFEVATGLYYVNVHKH